jgi:Sulfotransferase domain
VSRPAARASAALRARRTLQRALSVLHTDPHFLIIGAARSGTGTLTYLLKRHPNVVGSRGELRFFDDRWARGIGWYRLQFPARWTLWAAERAGHRPAITGEKSPFYLPHVQAPRRIRELLPEVRLMVLLRDPTARAVSHWQLLAATEYENRSLEEVLDEELGSGWQADPAGRGEQLALENAHDYEVVDASGGAAAAGDAERPTLARRPFVVRGIYVNQLRRWHALFPREQLLVLRSEDLFSDPNRVIGDVCRFLGIPDVGDLGPLHRHQGNPRPVEPTTLEALRELYRPQNAKLEAYLGREFGWD